MKVDLRVVLTVDHWADWRVAMMADNWVATMVVKMAGWKAE